MNEHGRDSAPYAALQDARRRAERVLAGTQTGRYTKRMLARDVLALSDAFNALADDALGLLDQHVSPEVHRETRLRIIERLLDGAALPLMRGGWHERT